MDRLEEALMKSAAFLKTEKIIREKERRIILHSLPKVCASIRPKKIFQGFISEIRRGNEPFVDVRVRRENYKTCTLTTKFRPRKQEATMRITREMYEHLWRKARSKQEKDRYDIGNGWIVDDIFGRDQQVVAEFEYGPGRTHCVVPESFHIKEDLGVR